MVTGETLSVHLHFAEVDAGPQDPDDGRVLDAGCRFDVTLARPIPGHGEDPLEDGCHFVGDEVSVNQVLAGLGPWMGSLPQ
jgi:hypothetical protein